MDQEEYEVRLIRQLREEAGAVKDCFTRFSFQAIMASSVILGALVGYQGKNTHIGFASILVVILLLSVARIGTYKYATANRHYGYELHLARSADMDDEDTGWKSEMREIKWEVAMRAWRVVQATVFEEIYHHGKLIPNHLRSKHRKTKKRWFQIETLVVPGAGYHAGSYVQTMLTVLHTLIVISMIPFWMSAMGFDAHETLELQDEQLEKSIEYWIVGIAIITSGMVFHRILKDRSRLNLLERGLLSIHSCALMWQAVVVAHYRAREQIDAMSPSDGTGYQNYLNHLSREAEDLKRHLFNIHRWIRCGGVENRLTARRSITEVLNENGGFMYKEDLFKAVSENVDTEAERADLEILLETMANAQHIEVKPNGYLKAIN